MPLPPTPPKTFSAGSIVGSVRLWVSLWVSASQKPCEHHISTINEENFIQFWSHTYFSSCICWLNFGIKRSKVKVTAGNEPKTLRTPWLKNQWTEFHPILVTYVFWFIDVLIRFRGQKVKGQGHSRREHNHQQQPVEFHLALYCRLLLDPKPHNAL